MKKMFCLLIAAVLLLTGCQSAVGPTDPAQTTQPTEAPAIIDVPEETTMPIILNPPLGTEPGDAIAFANPGKTRITYTGSRSYVRYITSVDQLPDEAALKGYDEAYFETKALLIIVDTVSSGSMRLEIGNITLRGDTASVTLDRKMDGDVGTADMATWLLWAEVEKGLDYTWTLTGGTNQPNLEKY